MWDAVKLEHQPGGSRPESEIFSSVPGSRISSDGFGMYLQSVDIQHDDVSHVAQNAATFCKVGTMKPLQLVLCINLS
jgi:hypothetical protein